MRVLSSNAVAEAEDTKVARVCIKRGCGNRGRTRGKVDEGDDAAGRHGQLRVRPRYGRVLYLDIGGIPAAEHTPLVRLEGWQLERADSLPPLLNLDV